MSMEDGTLRKLELYLHDLHKKIDGIYDMLMLRHERETEQKGSSAINEKLLDNQDLCLLFQISPRSLQRYRSLGVLPYKRLGQKTYYTEEDVMQFVENNVKESLKRIKPPKGTVMVLSVTEKQFAKADYITGKATNTVLDTDDRVTIL